MKKISSHVQEQNILKITKELWGELDVRKQNIESVERIGTLVQHFLSIATSIMDLAMQSMHSILAQQQAEQCAPYDPFNKMLHTRGRELI